MQWIDEKYIGIIGPYLGHFHRQGHSTYTFRCPFCGDSKRYQNKTRGYFFLHQSVYFFKCHNCQSSSSFRYFLKQFNPSLFQEYLLEAFRGADRLGLGKPLEPEQPATDHVALQRALNVLNLPTIASLPDGHVAKEYIRRRQLPTRAWEHLYFTNEFATWLPTCEFSEHYFLKEDHLPRLVIPWFGMDHRLLGMQVRELGTAGMRRYTTYKTHSNAKRHYGLDRVNLNSLIYLTEGPLDSWFLPNAVAALGSDLWTLYETYLMGKECVFVWDNEPRSPTIQSLMEKAISANARVVIWPKGLKAKDLNDMHLAGQNVYALVQERTFKGNQARLEFTQWKTKLELPHFLTPKY